MQVLKAENITAFHGKILAVDNVSFEVKKGDIVAIIGPNGAGKTTLLRTIIGLHKQFSGKVYFKDQDITNLPVHERIKLGMSLIPEGGHPFPYLTVYQNLLLGAYLLSKDRFEKNLNYIFQLFPVLKERKDQLAGTLSGGERKMLAIARALITNPEILIADELSLGLAPIIVETLFKVILKLKDEGITILLVEQNVKKALEVANRAYVMENGRIMFEGSCNELLRDERIRKTYMII